MECSARLQINTDCVHIALEQAVFALGPAHFPGILPPRPPPLHSLLSSPAVALRRHQCLTLQIVTLTTKRQKMTTIADFPTFRLTGRLCLFIADTPNSGRPRHMFTLALKHSFGPLNLTPLRF